jgi:hypothetical protein
VAWVSHLIATALRTQEDNSKSAKSQTKKALRGGMDKAMGWGRRRQSVSVTGPTDFIHTQHLGFSDGGAARTEHPRLRHVHAAQLAQVDRPLRCRLRDARIGPKNDQGLHAGQRTGRRTRLTRKGCCIIRLVDQARDRRVCFAGD